ncbi:unnamed protein product [Meganyctiphanes norvegica]|uniref:E2F/DP family winged-helix DNA-binding domain-containing protein n=1 Tax=Meganyctiphanes norvegica TaxID=48144 RepID=A0AAV2Q8F0_MEGNR
MKVVHPGLKELNRVIDSQSDRPLSNSLVLVTKQLAKLIIESPNFSVNINDAADILKVPKRRLNDITLVLEGAGLVYRPKKNFINWCLYPDLKYLANKENEIDGLIANAVFELMKLKHDKDLAYVTREDLDETYSDKTVMAMKVPPNTTMKVPENMTENGMILGFQSEDGPIELQLFIEGDHNDYIEKLT